MFNLIFELEIKNNNFYLKIIKIILNKDAILMIDSELFILK
jgi:hypothetical protein